MDDEYDCIEENCDGQLFEAMLTLRNNLNTIVASMSSFQMWKEKHDARFLKQIRNLSIKNKELSEANSLLFRSLQKMIYARNPEA